MILILKVNVKTYHKTRSVVIRIFQWKLCIEAKVFSTLQTNLKVLTWCYVHYFLLLTCIDRNMYEWDEWLSVTISQTVTFNTFTHDMLQIFFLIICSIYYLLNFQKEFLNTFRMHSCREGLYNSKFFCKFFWSQQVR